MNAPTFSVIVPTRARLAQLERCLEALAAQDYPTDRFEVLVVNDGSPPLPAEVLRRFEARLRLRSIDQPWGGPASARNTGIREAGGRFLAFTDDDCAPAPDWLRALEQALATTPTALIGGHVRNALDDDACATASQLLVDYLYSYYEKGRARGPRFFTSNNLCGEAEAVRTLGGFATSFRLPAGEDRDFADRWLASAAPLVYHRDAVVDHYHAMSLRAFTRQHFNYGRGAWTFHSARARRNGGRRELEPLAFYVGLAAWPWRRLPPARALVASLLLCWSQVVNATGYLLGRVAMR
jgi:glycosyltransferase involved in cell wall biosynthesis